MTRVTLAVVAALIASLALTGTAHAQLAAVDRAKRTNDLKQIGLAYHNYVDSFGKGPSKAADLAPLVENDKRLIGRLEKEIVFSYNVSLKDMTDGTSNTVLAYEKDVPTKGGLVLMGDASVKNVTAEEFKKAIVAKAKK